MYYDYYKSQYIDFKSSFFSSSKSTTSLILNSSDSQSTDIELCMFLITDLLILILNLKWLILHLFKVFIIIMNIF